MARTTTLDDFIRARDELASADRHRAAPMPPWPGSSRTRLEEALLIVAVLLGVFLLLALVTLIGMVVDFLYG